MTYIQWLSQYLKKNWKNARVDKDGNIWREWQDAEHVVMKILPYGVFVTDAGADWFTGMVSCCLGITLAKVMGGIIVGQDYLVKFGNFDKYI